MMASQRSQMKTEGRSAALLGGESGQEALGGWWQSVLLRAPSPQLTLQPRK